MGQNKINITAENSASWLASCGYLFPSNEAELIRFNSLFGGVDSSITGKEVDPFKIIRESKNVITYYKSIKGYSKGVYQDKLVAKQLNSLPQHIIRLIKKDENARKEDNRDITHKDGQ